MIWEKHGVILTPQPNSWYELATMLPLADDEIRTDGVRIYFSGRDSSGRARVGYFDADLRFEIVVGSVSPRPILDLGPLGAFDDGGVTAGCIVTHGNDKYLYYAGWTRGVSVPFYDFVGLAVSVDGGASFKRVSAGPILDRNDVDPYLTGPPFVMIEQGTWRMWYASGVRWELVDGSPKHFYHIRYAESADGIHWKREGHVCINFASADEYAIARPCVTKHAGGYRMWYSHRGAAYRIGYAESPDGITWQRADDLVGIDVSEAGWDSEMVAYAYVMERDETQHMFYNGNGYGRSGIGYARLAGSLPHTSV